MKQYLVIATFLLLVSGCSEVNRAEKIVASIGNQLKTEQEALAKSQSAQAYARVRLSGAYRDLNTAQSKKEFDKVARSGAAGMSEQLRAGKRMLDNPNYSSEQTSEESRASQRIDEARKALDYEEEEAKKNAGIVANTKTQLKQAEAVLAKLREAR